MLISLFWASFAFSQSKGISSQPWSRITPKKSKGLVSNSTLQFQLNLQSLAQKLIHTPSRNRYKNKPKKTIVSFPLPNGEFQKFLIEEANNFHPALAKQFPTIQAYAGTSIEGPFASIRFSLSQKGLTGIIQSGQYGTILIDPIARSNPYVYQVLYKKDLTNRPFTCEVKELINSGNRDKSNRRYNQINCELRTYRFALGCTGEYAQYHGGTVADALIAMNNTMTVVNGIFENDMAISLELIPNTTDLIYLNVENDPYSNTELTDMLGEHQAVCDTKIGISNYDIGHVFGTGLGGVAFLGVVCKENFKASGATGFPQPEGPIFAIDLVAHELGHQFGAKHTFNGDQVACAGSNRNNESAVEPGSGSTIMAYAGICSPQNVEDNSDAYFHAVSLQQMKEVISNSECETIGADFDNTEPIIVSSPSAFHIPISTPFALNLDATDLDNRELTYVWEQMDAGIGAIPPLPTNAKGPMFRSIPPSNSPTRYFPNLLDLSKNITPTWEVLSSVERTMNFRGTVRDNQNGGGCYQLKDVAVNVNAGMPFQVTYPNTQETWQAGTEKTIRWEVGNTTQSPINTQAVSILLSTDGGLTFPITLQNNVPNIGNATIVVPNVTTSNARIMVRAVGNIFFDLCNENFTITKPANDFEVTVISSQGICSPALGIFEIRLDETGNYREQVDLKVADLPTGVIAQFSNATPIVPAQVTLSISNTTHLNGIYYFNLITTGSTGEKTRGLNLNISSRPPNEIILSNPIDKQVNVAIAPTFSWKQDTLADSYQLEISTDLSFENPIFIRNEIEFSTFDLAVALDNNTQYFWRVRAENGCGMGNYSDIFSFRTLNINCENYTPTDLPITVPSIFTSTVSSTITIPDNGKLTSIQIENVQIAHSFIADLFVDIEAPSGESVRLVDGICFFEEDLELSFSDGANILNAEIPCPPTNQIFVQPLEQLNQLIGTEVKGDWKLVVRDNAILDGGSIERWDLNICYETPPPLAIAANRIGVSCAGGNDGMASVSPNGGSGTYSFTWSNGETSSIIQDLIAGTYSVTIFDGIVSMDTTIFIEEPRPLKIEAIIAKDGCIGGNNGAIEILTEGGTPNYQYNWSNGSTQSNLRNLNAGCYKVTVTDKIGCQAIDSIQLNVSEPLTILVDALVNPRCSAGETGSVFLTNAATTPTFYNWSNGLIGQNQFNLPIGNYSIYALDVNGCEDTLTIDIFQEEDTTAPTLILQTPTFYLDEFGHISLRAEAFDSGSFDDCSAVTLSLAQTEFDCQTIGNQTIDIIGIDAVGNEQKMEANFQLMDTIRPTLILNKPTIYLNENGIATLNTNHIDAGSFDNCGAFDLTFSQTVYTCQQLGAQDIFVSGKDANGNETLKPTTINVIDTIAPTLVYNTPILYLDDAGNTQIDLGDIDAGSFDNCGGVSLSLSSTTFDCQSVGRQIAELKGIDEQGNEKIVEVVLQIRDTIAPIFDCINELNFIGCQEITLTDFPTVTDNCNSVNIAIVEAGSIGYLADTTILSFRAIDKNGNHSFCYVPFERSNNFRLTTNSMPPLCANDRGEATVTVLEGQAPYQYIWNDEFGQTTPTALGLPQGNYTVTVMDNSGCILTQTVEFPLVNPIELIEVEIQAEINGEANGSINLQAIGGTGTLNPVWFKEDSLVGTTFNLTNLSKGIYRLNISDENDCRFSQDFSIDFLTNTKETTFIESIHIFPNPTSGKVVVDVQFKEKRDYSIQILDIMGRNILIRHPKEIKNSSGQYDLSHLENGLYFINFIFEEGVISRKLLLSK